MLDNEPVMPPPVFQDRKTLLVVFGILQIFVAVFICVLTALIIVNLILKKNDIIPFVNPFRMILPTLFFDGMFMVWLIWLGIGSIKARRWAWALTLAFSWLWLIGGVIGMVVLFVLIQDVFNISPNAEETYKMFVYSMTTVMMVMALVFFVLAPGALILVYSRKSIRLTCEFYDRKVRWTDRCHLPILVLVLLFGLLTLSLLGILLYARVAPIFGYLIGGFPGIVALLILTLVCTYLVWGMSRTDMKAWWLALVFVMATSVSTALTFYRMGLEGIYFSMRSPENLELFKKLISLKSMWGWKSTWGAIFGSWGVPIVGYLLFIRKYFVRKIHERL